MVEYVDCPYCEKETMVTFEENEPAQDIKDQCEHCDRWFIYQYESSVNIYARKDECEELEENNGE